MSECHCFIKQKSNPMKKNYKLLIFASFFLINSMSAQNINLNWAKQIGGTDSEIGYCVKVDLNGNVYTTGTFRGTTDFDPGSGTFNLTSAGEEDIFISKLDALGNFVWAKRIGSVNSDLGSSINFDLDGNVYTTGTFFGTVDFNPGTGTYNLSSSGERDCFITKLDGSGNFVWAKRFGGITDDYCNSIAIDAYGNVLTTGQFMNTVDFDPGSGTYTLTAVSQDIFVSKLDASGNFVWAKQFGGEATKNGNSIAVDAGGNVYTSGYFYQTVDFDPGINTYNLTPLGTYNFDVFISKLSSSGNFVWAKQLGGTHDEFGNSIALDVSGNVYTTGNFSGSCDFDPGTGTYYMNSEGNIDIFVSKLNASGNFVWAKKMGGATSYDYDEGLSITTDANGNVYTIGRFNGIADFDPGPGIYNLICSDSYATFISKLNSAGDFVWAKMNNGGSTSVNIGYSIAVSNNEIVYTTGFFTNTVDFASSYPYYFLSSYGATDVFIANYSQSANNLPLVKITNTILNNPLFTTPKTLWEGNTTQTPETIKICADGSQATKIQFSNNTWISSENIKFLIESDPYGNNSDLTGFFINYSVEGDIITAEYSHPKYLPSSEGLFRSDNIRIVDNLNPGASIFTIPIRIYRAPVLFVHGLNGDATTFESMASSLVNNSFYTSVIRKVVDYHSTSKEAFSSNVDEIPKGINDLLDLSRNVFKYSAGKVDIVSHSMGGILSRLYLQSNYGYVYRGDVNKLITLNTPHSGSQFANWAVINPLVTTACGFSTLFFQSSWLCNGAGIDLQTYSYAIDHVLNSPSSLTHGHVPSHTVSTFIDNWDIGSCVNPIALAVLALNGLTVPIIFGFGEQMDGVVRLDSQIAGLNGLHTSIPIEQCHLGAAENSVIINDVTQLLCENPNSSKFSLVGFNPEDMKLKQSLFPILNEENAVSKLGSPSSFVNIISPLNGSSFNANQTIAITVTSDTSIKRIAFMMGNISLGVSYIDTTITSNTVTVNYLIPPEAQGQLEIDVIGFDPVNILASNSVTVNVTTNAIIDSIVTIPNHILVPVDNTNHFQVMGYFSDGISRDITLLSGVQFSTADNSIAKINTPGVIEGVSSDSTLLIVAFQDVSDTIPVYVYQDSTLSLPIFSSNTNVICGQNGVVTFYDLSSGNPQRIQWLFPGGSPETSIDSMPFINYATPGTYDVSLIATYPNKVDTLYMPGYITVSNPPESTLNFTNGNIYTSYTNGAAYLWYYNGTPIVNSNQSFILPDSVGEYYVDVMNDAGCIERSNSYFYSPFGINSLSDESHILLYPNPTLGTFTLDIGNYRSTRIKVINLLGSNIFESEIYLQKTSLDLSTYPAGIYFVQLYVVDKIYSKKLIIY